MTSLQESAVEMRTLWPFLFERSHALVLTFSISSSFKSWVCVCHKAVFASSVFQLWYSFLI
jgi:hypothetical protein